MDTRWSPPPPPHPCLFNLTGVLLLCLPLVRLHKLSRGGGSGEVEGRPKGFADFADITNRLLESRNLHVYASFQFLLYVTFSSSPRDMLG